MPDFPNPSYGFLTKLEFDFLINNCSCKYAIEFRQIKEAMRIRRNKYRAKCRKIERESAQNVAQ